MNSENESVNTKDNNGNSYINTLVYTNDAKSYDPMSQMSSQRINSRHQISYINPRTGKKQTQNYLDMNDIVIPIIIKKGKDGQIYFAMEMTYIAAAKMNSLELPSIGMQEQKESYSDLDILTSVTNLTDMLQLSQTNGNINYLSSNYDPVSQSFTNQTAKIVELGVKNEQGDKRLNWFPVSCLQDILSRDDIPMSIQTKYALLLFADKHKAEITKLNQTPKDITLTEQEKSEIEQEKFDTNSNDKIIMPHKYRFGVAEKEIPGNIQNARGIGLLDYASDTIEDNTNGISKETSVYGMSKNSIQCVLRRVHNGKVQVGLMPQHRSPFITKEKIDEVFIETPAGMIEEIDYNNTDSDNIAGKNAAIREVREEAKIDISPDWLESLSQDLLLSQGTAEFSKFYMVKLPENYKTLEEENQDEQEAIGKIIWYDLDTLDIDKLHAPMPTKIALLMTKNQLQREQELYKNNLNTTKQQEVVR